ncbi:MAG: hypothetical protein F6K55_34565 [Moorea sp. SIO4A3]|nr:hypothetical protein [Moorena sp. SIO4A3]
MQWPDGVFPTRGMADKVRYLDQALDQDISMTITPHHPILSSPHYQLT